jgi:hypothetical protein
MTISSEIADALVALDELRGEPTVDEERVGLVGLSLGGLVAACTAARDGGVSALVLWSAVANMEELVRDRWQMPAEPGAPGARDYYEHGPHEIGAEFLRDALEVKPLEEIPQYSGPVLVVHGDDDQSVPLEHAHRYMDAITSEDASLLVVEDADHTYSSVSLEQIVIEATTGFLADRL